MKWMQVRDSTQSVSIFPPFFYRWSTSKALTSSTYSWQMWYSLANQSASANFSTTIGSWGTMETLAATRQILLPRTPSEKKSVNRANFWGYFPLLKQSHLDSNQTVAMSRPLMVLEAQEAKRKRKPMPPKLRHLLLNCNSIIAQWQSNSISFKKSKRLSLSRL